MDFYQAAPINYIWFSQEGRFAKLQEAVGKEPEEEWTKDELLKFSSIIPGFPGNTRRRAGAS